MCSEWCQDSTILVGRDKTSQCLIGRVTALTSGMRRPAKLTRVDAQNSQGETCPSGELRGHEKQALAQAQAQAQMLEQVGASVE